MAMLKPRPTMISLAASRVTTRHMTRPTRGADDERGGERASAALPVAAETSDRRQRAGQHHQLEADVDEAADAVDRPPIAASRIGVVISIAA